MQTDEAIDDELIIRHPVTHALKITKQINFIVVGPFVQEATKGTGKCMCSPMHYLTYCIQ